MGADLLAFLGILWRNPLVKYALAVLAVLGGIKIYGASERRRGAAEAGAKATARTLERVDDGTKAVAREREALRGAPPDELVRSLRDRTRRWR